MMMKSTQESAFVEHLTHHPINISHKSLPLSLLRPASFLAFNVSVSRFRTAQLYT